MASRLAVSGFADGVLFHSYHAYECVLSALIAARGYEVPPDGWTKLTLPSGKKIGAYHSPAGGIQERQAHKARIAFAAELIDSSVPYNAEYRLLASFLTSDFRMDTLYYKADTDTLPHQMLNMDSARELLAEVRRFAHLIWQDIR